MKQKILTLMVALAAMLSGFSVSAQGDVLAVAGTHIDPAESCDITSKYIKSGTAKYDAATKTVILDNVVIDKVMNGIYCEMPDLNVQIIGTVNITSLSTGIEASNNLTIYGENTAKSRLNVSTDGCPIRNSNGTITIRYMSLYTGRFKKYWWGISGGKNSHLNIKSSYIRTTGCHQAFQDFSSMTITGCGITYPAGAAFDSNLKGIALDGKLVETVVISPELPQYYELKVAGIRVSDKNKDDIRGYGIKGSVKYDSERNILYLKDADISSEKSPRISILDSLSGNPGRG